MSNTESSKHEQNLGKYGIAIMVLCGLCIFFFKGQMTKAQKKWKKRYSQLYYLPSPNTLKTVSLGHKAFLADLIWIRGLLYVGTHLSKENGGIHWLPKYVNAIVELDPKFRQAYSWGAALIVYNREKSTRERVYKAMAILEKGRKNFPDDYYFPEAIGMAYLADIRLSDRKMKGLKRDYRAYCRKKVPALKRIPLLKKVRVCLRKIAGEYMFEAATKDNAPPHVATRGAGFMGRSMGKSGHIAICSHLIDVLSLSNSEDVRIQVRKKMSYYCSYQVKKVLFCKEKAYTHRWKSTLPFVSRTLFGMLDIHPNIVKGTPVTFPFPKLPETICEEN